MLRGLWDGAGEVGPLSLDALVRHRVTVLGTHKPQQHGGDHAEPMAAIDHRWSAARAMVLEPRRHPLRHVVVSAVPMGVLDCRGGVADAAHSVNGLHDGTPELVLPIR